MVVLNVKKGDESQMLTECLTLCPVETLIQQVSTIYNGRLKVFRICEHVNQLAEHGVALPPNMVGLTDEQIVELKLVDEWEDKCIPSGGYEEKRDAIGLRNGRAPTKQIADVLNKSVEEAKAMISKDLVAKGIFLTEEMVQEALRILSGATTIAYPMGLPPHDPIKMELMNTEDLSGTQASKDVIVSDEMCLWFSGKELQRGKLLSDFCGRNEKTKVVVKINKKGSGPPGREPIITEEQQKGMMAYYYKKQEEYKSLEKEARDDDSGLDSAWADGRSLKRSLHGMNQVKWGPR